MTRVLLILLTLTAAGCASTGATPRPFPRPGAPAPGAPGEAPPPPSATAPPPATTAPGTAAGDGYAIAGTALSFRGVPYRNGGHDPGGFDCSGFVYYVFEQYGIALPRTVSEQYRTGLDAGDHLEAGDLVFFTTTAPGPSHVGILIGGDEFVHAPSSAGTVRVERLSTGYWSTRYIGARRIR
jgi:cell wall-associated NlpC family hydrolase